MLFGYPEQPEAARGGGPGGGRARGRGAPAAGARARPGPPRRRCGSAFVGAGNYATSMLLPHLAQREGVELSTVVTTTALSAANAQRKFGFAAATTDLDAVLGDESVDAVFVVTRHSSHADLTCQALLAGKAVFVEKPLALDRGRAGRRARGGGGVRQRPAAGRASTAGSRRCCSEAEKRFGRPDRPGEPALPGQRRAARRTAAGTCGRAPRARGSPARAGTSSTRRAGSLGADPVSVYAVATRRQRGPAGRAAATRTGPRPRSAMSPPVPPGFPKETLDLVADGKVLRLDDFVACLGLHGRKPLGQFAAAQGPGQGPGRRTGRVRRAVRTGGPMPVPLESLVATTAATLAVQAAPRRRRAR